MLVVGTFHNAPPNFANYLTVADHYTAQLRLLDLSCLSALILLDIIRRAVVAIICVRPPHGA